MSQPPPPTFEIRVAQYIALRNLIRKEDDEHKEKMSKKRELLDMLNNQLLYMLDQSGAQSARTMAGTVYRKETKSATIADAATFRRYVIGSEAYDLVDWRANATAVAEYITENGEPPPGLNYRTTINVGVRKGTE